MSELVRVSKFSSIAKRLESLVHEDMRHDSSESVSQAAFISTRICLSLLLLATIRSLIPPSPCEDYAHTLLLPPLAPLLRSSLSDYRAMYELKVGVQVFRMKGKLSR